MTSAEKRTILEAAISKTYMALDDVDKKDMAAVSDLIHNLTLFESLLSGLGDTDTRPDNFIEPPAPNPEDSERPETGSAVPNGTPDPEPSLTKDEVKAKLLELSGKYDALDVAALMEGMGYTRLSDVPAVKYQELLDKADAAVKELS